MEMRKELDEIKKLLESIHNKIDKTLGIGGAK
jgi:uncharacterized coiled-coil DUF342 family protein